MTKIVKQVWLVHDLSTNEEYVSSMGPPYDDPDTYVLAGPTTVEFDVPDVARCPHCNNVLPEAEKPKLPLLPLVVGGVYRTGQDDLETIIAISDNSQRQCPVVTKDGYSYALDGRYCPPHESSYDLIERIA